MIDIGTWKKANGKWYEASGRTLTRPHHTAIVIEVRKDGSVLVVEQNVHPNPRKVTRNVIPKLDPGEETRRVSSEEKIKLKVTGSVSAYRPIPKPEKGASLLYPGRSAPAGGTATMYESIILVTGTASEVFTGRAAQLSLWKKEFENPGRAVYVRTTDCVRVSEVFPVALETGLWRGVREGQADGSGAKSFAAGVYAAKWRRVDGTWLLEAEIFTTEACGGDFCPVDDGYVP